MTTGVAITRGSSGGLYNAVTESGATAGVSPKDTEWALGSLTDFATLTYGPCPLESGNRPPNDVGNTYVVHLVNENIYLSLTLTGWGGAGGSGDNTFSYTRTTPASSIPPPTPTVSISSPASDADFPAPANISITADTSVNGGSVTNVQFFANGNSLGSAHTAPFSVTANDLAAGPYSLTAVATAAGISATSAVVSITVLSAPSVVITGPHNGATFSAPANVTVTAAAEVSGATVTNVQFFNNGASLGSVAAAPFTVAANNLGAGAYALTAVATAAGISATSEVVSISVVVPTATTISGASVSGGQFTFNYTANQGQSYVVETSSDLVNWVAAATNIASGSSALFSGLFNPTGNQYYRVQLLTNP
jgi:hypothetical protein